MNWFFNKKKEIKSKKEIKEFTFSLLEAELQGTQYKYTVKAKNEKEAFNKLVQYFFGENINQEIESQSGNVHYPYQSKFITNMPHWFAKRISGHVRDEKTDYQKELEIYAIENNIKLKKD